MLSTLPEYFRGHGLTADVRTLLLLRKAMERSLVVTLGDLYNVLKGIIVKKPEDVGPFTKAYYGYFINVDVKYGQSLEDAILRSETFQKWKASKLDESDLDTDVDLEELVNQFLDEVHLTSYDIKEVISGRDIFDKNDADQEDIPSEEDAQSIEQQLEKMADYTDIPLQELFDRLEEIKKQQKDRHGGGSHWVGTGGISPFGHGGAAKNGIRIGGAGGGKMARKVMGDKTSSL